MEDAEEAKRRIEQLRVKITEHDRRYHLEAAPIISDQEYDRLFQDGVSTISGSGFAVTTRRSDTTRGVQAVDAFNADAEFG